MSAALTRLPDWPERLHAAVAAGPRRFRWGRDDCALWVARCVEAMTGVDLAARYRGRYTSAAGAAEALEANGHTTLAEAVTAALGPPVRPALARRGDVVEVLAATGCALAIVTGPVAVSAGPAGPVAVHRRCWVRAWRVG